jgi:predicted ATPase/DNA-binding SARP family transcriptional activator
MLTVAVLGPVEVRRDGELIAVPTGKTTEVLIRLALAAGQLIPADRIIADLWSTAVEVGKNTLQSKVSQLRKALGDTGLIHSGHGGYRLGIEASCVDALQVVEQAANAHGLRGSGQWAAAVEASNGGLALFRGTVLLDAGDGEWLHPYIAQLENVRVGLLEDQLAAKVQLGAGGEVVGQLQALVAQYPLREALWYWLIAALYHAGRQADALAAYAQVRQTLVDELGIEPGSELRELETRVLQQSVEVGLVKERGMTVPPAAGNLPRATSRLIGRSADLRAIGTLVGERRLVTLVGAPGVGKTRLAIEVARQAGAAGGSWLIRLDAIDLHANISQVVAETLKLPGEGALIERVASTETLLIFDNCEHVIEAATDLIDRLLDASTGLRVLATSQLPLGVDGETIYQVEPLTEADSVVLFTTRATEIRPRWLPGVDGPDEIANLCRSLDGLPLAIELAAARVKSLSVQEISRRLDNRFDVLQDPTSRRPERRRALAAAIGWSYDLLFPDDQRGLWGLSCFAGGATLAAVEHVLAVFGVPPAAAVDAVSRLVDRSLVQVTTTDDGVVRYRLLDSIRVYAAERLRESTFGPAVFTAHATWYAENADRCAETVRGPGQSDCVAFVQQERANIDAALSWAAGNSPALGVRIANGFGWTWVVLGDGVAGATRIRAALSAAVDLNSASDRAMGMLLAGWLEASAGNLDRAGNDFDQAAVAIARLSDPPSDIQALTADLYRYRAFLGLQQGRAQDALADAQQSLAADRAMGRRWEQAGGLLLAASASAMLGDISGADAAARTALELWQPIGDSWGLVVHGEAMLGAIAQADHRFDDAAEHLANAAESSRRLGFLGQQAYHLTRLGRVQQQAGNDELAVKTLFRAIEAASDDGDLRMAATARINLARVLRGTDRNQDAVTLLEQANAWYQNAGAGDGALLSRVLLAAATGDRAAGTGELELVLDDARSVNDVEVQVLALDALARLAARAGEVDRAAQLLQVADDQNTLNPIGPDELDRFDARLARRLISTVDDVG